MLNKYIKNFFILAIILSSTVYTAYYLKINFENYLSWQKKEYANMNKVYSKTYESLEHSYTLKIQEVKKELELLKIKVKEKQDFDPILQQMRFLQGNLQTVKYLISYSGNLNKALSLLQEQISYVNDLKDKINVGVLFNLSKEEVSKIASEYENNKFKIYSLIEKIKSLPIQILDKEESSNQPMNKKLFKYYDVSKNSFFTKSEATIFVNQLEIIQNQLLMISRINDITLLKDIQMFLTKVVKLYAPNHEKEKLINQIDDLYSNTINTPNLDKLLLNLDSEIINYAND